MLKNQFQFVDRITEPRKLNKGEKFELEMGYHFNAEGYHPVAPATKSGDLTIKKIEFQCKADRGFWENVRNLAEFKTFIFTQCKAERYLLKISTSKNWALNVNKNELIKLAENGYIKFNQPAFGKSCARWSMTIKEGIHLKMKLDIDYFEYESLI